LLDLVEALLPQLEVLELTRCELQRGEILRILAAGRPFALRELLLAGNPLGGHRPRDLENWFAGRLPQNLHRLDLRHCGLSEELARAINGYQTLTRLTRLNVGFNSLGREWLEELASAPHLGRLRHLGLAGVRGLAAQRTGRFDVALLDSPNLPRLAALDLSHNDLDARAAAALAATNLPARLYHLDLRHNRLGDEGALALLAADWPRLAWLDVRDNRLTATGKALLRERFGYTVHY
jgi:hypothetical protein